MTSKREETRERDALLAEKDMADGAVAADATFTVLMGEKVEPRKEFIEQKAKYAVNLDY